MMLNPLHITCVGLLIGFRVPSIKSDIYMWHRGLGTLEMAVVVFFFFFFFFFFLGGGGGRYIPKFCSRMDL